METKILKKNNDYVIYFDDGTNESSFSVSEWQEINGTEKYFCRIGATHYADIINQNLPTGSTKYISYTPKKPKFMSIKDVVKWMAKNRIDNT